MTTIFVVINGDNDDNKDEKRQEIMVYGDD